MLIMRNACLITVLHSVKSCDGPPMSGPIDVLTHLFGELAAVGNTLCIKMLCEVCMDTHMHIHMYIFHLL